VGADDSAAGAEIERTWRRIGRIAGYLAAACLAVATVLYLLDALDALGTGPTYHATDAGPLQDEADFRVAYFAHQHHILWDVVGRDTLFPLAFVALMVMTLAVRNVGRSMRRPEAQMTVVALRRRRDAVGARRSDLSRRSGALAHDGLERGPGARMVAVGRSSGALESLTTWPEAAGFVILAGGLVCLARLPSRRLGLLVQAEALLLLGIALAGVTHAGTAYDIFSLLTGALVGPAVASSIGGRSGAPPRQRPQRLPPS
jgi:hypothetical protein